MSNRDLSLNGINALLAEMGGLYTFEDLIDRIKSGNMQSFALNDSWVVTQVCEFPQKRVLDIVLAAGDLEDLRTLHTEVMEFARENRVEMLMTCARDGWKVEAKSRGWRRVMSLFLKDVDHGS